MAIFSNEHISVGFCKVHKQIDFVLCYACGWKEKGSGHTNPGQLSTVQTLCKVMFRDSNAPSSL